MRINDSPRQLNSQTQQLLVRLEHEAAVLVRVQASRGSVPREVGAWMAVFAQNSLGTVGGGQVEWAAMHHARHLLAHGVVTEESERFALGPSLGQCCGGEMRLSFRQVNALDRAALRQLLVEPRFSVALFGGGHVGQALVRVLAPLPVHLRWIDSRDGIFGEGLPWNVDCEHSDPVHAAVANVPARSLVLIMSFSHAEDLDIVLACLERQRASADLPYVGLIGSKTKWATFCKRLLARGFTEQELGHITCPIGLAGIYDKRPEVIAVSVAAQLLQVPVM